MTFDLPAPTPDDLYADVAEAIRHFGHVRPAATGWLAENLSALWFNNPERKIIGLSDASEMLTDAGRALGVNGFEKTIQRASCRFYLAKEYAANRRYLAQKLPNEAVEVLTTSLRRCCEHARALAGKRFFTAQTLPTLPLPSCDYDVCGCSYRGISAYELEREGGDHT